MKLRYWISLIFVLAFALLSATVNATETSEKKKYPDPHSIHLGIYKEIPPIGFTVRRIKDWPKFIRSLQDNIDKLAVGNEIKLFLKSLMPNLLSRDDKAIIVSQLNKFLDKPDFYAQMKDVVKYSKTTKTLLANYHRTKAFEDLKWLNRSILSDLITVAPRVDYAKGIKFRKLRNISCTTCHESWGREVKVAAISAGPISVLPSKRRQVLQSDRRMKVMTQNSKVPKIVADDEFLRNYDNLKKFIVRPEVVLEPLLLRGVRPENPYIFKPLLKRLVCVECHGYNRPVKQLIKDGKPDVVKVFYGPIEETLPKANLFSK